MVKLDNGRETRVYEVTIDPEIVLLEKETSVKLTVLIQWSRNEITLDKEYYLIVSSPNSELVFPEAEKKIKYESDFNIDDLYTVEFEGNIQATVAVESSIEVNLYEVDRTFVDHGYVDFNVSPYPSVVYCNVQLPVIVIATSSNIPFGPERVVTNSNINDIFLYYTFSGHEFIKELISKWFTDKKLSSVILVCSDQYGLSFGNRLAGWSQTDSTNRFPNIAFISTINDVIDSYQTGRLEITKREMHDINRFIHDPDLHDWWHCYSGKLTYYNLDGTVSEVGFYVVNDSSCGLSEVGGNRPTDKQLEDKESSPSNKDGYKYYACHLGMEDTSTWVERHVDKKSKPENQDPIIGYIILTGSQKILAVGMTADIYTSSSKIAMTDQNSFAITNAPIVAGVDTYAQYLVEGAYSDFYHYQLELRVSSSDSSKTNASLIMKQLDPSMPIRKLFDVDVPSKTIGKAILEIPRFKLVSSKATGNVVVPGNGVNNNKYSISYGSKVYDLYSAFSFLGLIDTRELKSADGISNIRFPYFYGVNLMLSQLALTVDMPNMNSIVISRYMYAPNVSDDEDDDDDENTDLVSKPLWDFLHTVFECQYLIDDCALSYLEPAKDVGYRRCVVITTSSTSRGSSREINQYRHGYSDKGLYSIRDVHPYKYSESKVTEMFDVEFWADVQYDGEHAEYVITLYNTRVYGNTDAPKAEFYVVKDKDYDSKGYATTYLLSIIGNSKRYNDVLELEFSVWDRKLSGANGHDTIFVSGYAPDTVENVILNTYAYSHPSVIEKDVQYCYCYSSGYDSYGLLVAGVKIGSSSDISVHYEGNKTGKPVSFKASNGLDVTISGSIEFLCWFPDASETEPGNYVIRAMFKRYSLTGQYVIEMTVHEGLVAGFKFDNYTSTLKINNEYVEILFKLCTDTTLVFSLPSSVVQTSVLTNNWIDIEVTQKWHSIYIAFNGSSNLLSVIRKDNPGNETDAVYKQFAGDCVLFSYPLGYKGYLKYKTSDIQIRDYTLYEGDLGYIKDFTTSDYMNLIPGVDVVSGRSKLIDNYECYLMYSSVSNSGSGSLSIRR